MMKGKWYDAECISNTQPELKDDTSSRKVIYLRKDFVFHAEEGTAGTEEYKPAKWTYKEITIPKEVAQLLAMTETNTDSIALIEDALCELDMEA